MPILIRNVIFADSMKNISISDNHHEQLLKIAAKLQGKTGKKVSIDDALTEVLARYNA